MVFLVILAPLEEVISLRDPELNKEKEKYDHDKIQRLQVQSKHESLRKHQEDFEIIHVAYLLSGKLSDSIDDIEDYSVAEAREALYRCET